MKTNKFHFTAPLIRTIESSKRPTTFAVAFPERNTRVKMVVRGIHVNITDEAIEDVSRGRRQLNWNGTVNKLFRTYPGAADVQDAFRRYVRNWYCTSSEVVV
jgi:hypothetical protein